MFTSAYIEEILVFSFRLQEQRNERKGSGKQLSLSKMYWSKQR